jgi:hypothetical protein
VLHRTPTHLYRTTTAGRTERVPVMRWRRVLVSACISMAFNLLALAVALGIAEGGVW